MWSHNSTDYCLEARSQNCENRQLASSHLSVLPVLRMNNSATTGRIFLKFDIRPLFENLSKKFKFR
jgi:hypothetical protein